MNASAASEGQRPARKPAQGNALGRDSQSDQPCKGETSPLVSPRNLALFAVLAATMAGCGPADSKTTTGSDTKPGASTDLDPAETALREKLKPTLSAPLPTTADATAKPSPPATSGATAPTPTAATPSAPWNPTTIFPVPVRTWLPPADLFEKASALPGDQRIPNTAPFTLPETALPSPPVALPAPLVLTATAREFSIGPNPALITVWIATSPAPEMRGRPPAWDRPQLATDPTEAIIRTAPLATPTGLRETPPPFLRVSLPDPFEQINIAELRTPPPEIDAPVASFFRPPVSLPVDPAAKQRPCTLRKPPSSIVVAPVSQFALRACPDATRSVEFPSPPTNANGVSSTSPGLRAARYPGGE